MNASARTRRAAVDSTFFENIVRISANYNYKIMKKSKGIGIFEKYLTLWVVLCIIAGIAVGKWLPAVPQVLGKMEYANVSLPVAALIWMMIYPMMLKVDFRSILNV